MYTQCTTEKASIQQRTFEECLLASMRHQSYQEISVISLCEKTGLSRKTFYRLFGCKDDVLCALVDHCLLSFERYSLPNRNASRSTPDELIRFFAYWKEQKPLLDALSENHQSALLIERSIRYISQEQTSTLRWLGAVDHPNSRQILLFFVSGLMGLVIDWHHNGYGASTEETAAVAFQLLANPPLRLPIPEDFQ